MLVWIYRSMIAMDIHGHIRAGKDSTMDINASMDLLIHDCHGYPSNPCLQGFKRAMHGYPCLPLIGKSIKCMDNHGGKDIRNRHGFDHYRELWISMVHIDIHARHGYSIDDISVSMLPCKI